MSQEQRDRVMRLFRANTANLLIATDVAARGLDVDHLSHVINYHLPAATESYVHRTGRVGRAGREGVAITLVEPNEQRLLRNIERVTAQRIDIAQVPSVADLRARRLERTRATLREIIEEGGLDDYRAVVEALGEEFSPNDVAMAAFKLAHRASGAADVADEHIPTPAPVPDRTRFANEWSGDNRPRRGSTPGRPMAGTARVFIGVGREAGITPRDLVGAITNEAGITSRDIGAIDVGERYSLVDVPESVARRVVEALRNARIKGKKATVRRDRRWGD
jgi:ATP-dependent RNA helicase DeaD